MVHITRGVYVKMATRINELRYMDRERGLTTTEIAVLTFVLVTMAFGIGALLYAFAQQRVEDLPTDIPDITTGE